MKGGHHFTVTVKGHLTASGVFVTYNLCGAPQFIPLIDKGCLCGIPNLLAIFIGGVIAEDTVAEKLFLCGIIQVNILCRNLTALHIVVFHSHFVLGQGACFV